MAVRLYREYRLKFYLNARHYIVIDGKKGELHPHTWELSLTIRIGRGSFTQFDTFEKRVNEFLAPYQNRVLNQCPPFDAVLPTLENLADHFSRELPPLIIQAGGELTNIELSETPSRSYVLDLEHSEKARSKELEDKMLLDMIDTVLDSIL